MTLDYIIIVAKSRFLYSSPRRKILLESRDERLSELVLLWMCPGADWNMHTAGSELPSSAVGASVARCLLLKFFVHCVGTASDLVGERFTFEFLQQYFKRLSSSV